MSPAIRSIASLRPSLPSAVGMSSAIPASASRRSSNASVSSVWASASSSGVSSPSTRLSRPSAVPRSEAICASRLSSSVPFGGSSSRAKNSLESWLDWVAIELRSET